MSTADPRRRSQAGFTFVEVTVALALLALMSLMIERTLTTTYNSERYLSAVRKATERGHKISYEIFDAVSASRKLFQRDTFGEDYLDALDLGGDPIDVNARLPLFDEVSAMGPDQVGDPRTGNVLLFVRESDPAPCVADAATNRIRYIDTYRFICVYPHLSDQKILTDDPLDALDLVIWRSIPYPSLSQINAIQDVGERKKVVSDLYSRYGHELAWDPNEPVDQAFYELDFLGTVNGVPEAAPVVEADPDATAGGRLVYARAQLARTDAASYHRRAVFTLDDPTIWVPDGFEVKVSGASGSRKVWLHLVVECQARRGEAAVHENTMVVSTRDL